MVLCDLDQAAVSVKIDPAVAKICIEELIVLYECSTDRAAHSATVTALHYLAKPVVSIKYRI